MLLKLVSFWATHSSNLITTKWSLSRFLPLHIPDLTIKQRAVSLEPSSLQNDSDADDYLQLYERSKKKKKERKKEKRFPQVLYGYGKMGMEVLGSLSGDFQGAFGSCFVACWIQ
jgi:hypothetical protein